MSSWPLVPRKHRDPEPDAGRSVDAQSRARARRTTPCRKDGDDAPCRCDRQGFLRRCAGAERTAGRRPAPIGRWQRRQGRDLGVEFPASSRALHRRALHGRGAAYGECARLTEGRGLQPSLDDLAYARLPVRRRHRLARACGSISSRRCALAGLRGSGSRP